eukprot:UN03466
MFPWKNGRKTTVSGLVASALTVAKGSTVELALSNLLSQGFVHVTCGTLSGSDSLDCSNQMIRWNNNAGTISYTAPNSDTSCVMTIATAGGQNGVNTQTVNINVVTSNNGNVLMI